MAGKDVLMLKTKLEEGQGLLELVIVITVVVIVLGGLTVATISTIRNASFSKNQILATKLAQEGIERVRAGRDRNYAITGLPGITSWNGDTTGTGSIWANPLEGSCADSIASPPTYCYFKIESDGRLTFLSSQSSIPSGAENIAPNFRRVAIVGDYSIPFATQKKVTVIVGWTDVSGTHESKLITILRKP